MKCTEIVYRNPADIQLLAENPRKIKKEDFQRLVDSIHINGFWNHRPLGCEEKDGQLTVLAGNQRLKAAKNVSKEHSKNYKSGWSTTTNKPVAHTVTHELAHATWNAHMTSANHKAAGKDVEALYKKWGKDTKKKGYGKYAETNVSEFWAETVTKAVHGKPDKYTRAVKAIVKKYQL